MRTKLQVILHISVVAAMLLAAIGIIPTSASIQQTRVSAIAMKAMSNSLSKDLDTPTVNKKFLGEDGQEVEGDPLVRDDWFYSTRATHDPNVNFTLADAAALRATAANQLSGQFANQPAKPTSPLAFGGSWTSAGPNPMVLVDRGDNSFDAMAGRIGALAIRSTSPYTLYLGGAQGGVWTMAYPYTGTWTAKTDNLGSLAIGALALAPSNENIVYVGTGEGALSGDSYFGNGILKSTNGGNSFTHISAAGYFTKVSISKIVVDNSNPNTLYAGTLRGRGGARRTSPPDASPFGVYKSTDGGVNWTPVLTVSTDALAFSGITDLAMDPQNSQVIFASILGSGISKTVNGGTTWTTAMNGLPAGVYSLAPTRIALGISRPSAVVSATLYAGFEYYDTVPAYHSSRVFKSTNSGNTWSLTTDTGNVVRDYCGSQCWYDNVIGVDPTNPNTVYVLGLYNYTTGSGGVFRSTDGGTNWVDLGFNLHPDYHAIAIRKDNPSIVVIGNDGGAWWSASKGGRLGAGDSITMTQWDNLNGIVDPDTADVLFRSGLALGQFSSVATNPAVANRFYGGTQDNGTLRKSTGTQTWFDTASGDGGQVLVDPTDANYVYGTYYNFSGGPYRFTDGMGSFFTNDAIQSGINTSDRSEFYIPMIMDPADPNHLYLGSYRVYRTDNAKTASANNVFWNTISGDLTSGCTGAAANGGRGCVITALGKSAGSPALYVGTMEGWIWVAADSTVASPVWQRVDITTTIPGRPISAVAVDSSNYRVAYVGISGFDPATPATPGHVFATANAGQTWTNITGDLPDIPVNSLDLDPSDPNTLYAGTDIGPYVTHNGGANWTLLGSGFPIVSIEQMALNPFTRQLIAGTHGRGVWSITDAVTTTLPALQISKHDAGNPVGPGFLLQYTISLENHGNITATDVVITDPVPANTSFVAAGSGGSFDGTNVVFHLSDVAMPTIVHTDPSTWPTNTLPVGLQPGVATVTFTVQITSSNVVTAGSIITNDGYFATSAEVAPVYGSPFYVTIAPANAVAVTPANQAFGTRPGRSITYTLNVHNISFNTDNYHLSVTGNAWPTTIWNAGQSAQITQTGNIAPSNSLDVVLKVTLPATAADGLTDMATLVARSAAVPSVSGSADVQSAVTYPILIVDGDGGGPNVESFYKTAVASTSYVHYDYWDLSTNNDLPLSYMKDHKVLVWFTGASYPDPITPYESDLASFLDNGGRLFMSGQDILDQSAGTTAFVHNYLHINWDGSEIQNDIGVLTVTSVLTSPVTAGLGAFPMNYAIFGGVDFSDEITPIAPAVPAFTDDSNKPDALSVWPGRYRVIFLAFPFESMGTAANRAALMQPALDYLFTKEVEVFLPLVRK